MDQETSTTRDMTKITPVPIKKVGKPSSESDSARSKKEESRSNANESYSRSSNQSGMNYFNHANITAGHRISTRYTKEVAEISDTEPITNMRGDFISSAHKWESRPKPGTDRYPRMGTSASPTAPTNSVDIVDLIAPNPQSRSGVTLFEAPLWMKRALGSPEAAAARASAPNSPAILRQPTPVRVVGQDETAGQTTSYFKRSDSLPPSATRAHRSTDKVPADAHSKVLAVRKEGDGRSAFVRSHSERRTRGPVQIVHGSLDDQRVIEINSGRLTEQQKSGTKTDDQREPNMKNFTKHSAYSASVSENTIIPSDHVRMEVQREQRVIPVSVNTTHESSASAMPSHKQSGWNESITMERETTVRPAGSYTRSYRSVQGNAVTTNTIRSTKIPVSGGGDIPVHQDSGRPVGLPPVPQRTGSGSYSTVLTKVVGQSENLSLSPVTAPVEHVVNRVNPVTGEVQKVTSRSQTFSDPTQNVVMTEEKEDVEGGSSTEVHIRRHTIKKHKSSSSREGISPTPISRTPAPPLQAPNQSFKSTESDTAEWQSQFAYNRDARTFPRTATRPYRASSQVNVSRGAPMTKNQWISESNLQTTTTTYKQPPIYSTYSAHRENLRRREEEQKRNTEEWQQSSVRQVEQSKTTGGTEVLEEMETITLQPIGRGVHDLEPTGSIARSFRANTPTASRPYTPGADQSDGYRTIATTNLHRETHVSGTQSPYPGVHQNSFYETMTPGTEQRYRTATTTQSETQWRSATTNVNAYPPPISPMGSLGGASGAVDMVDSDLMRQVQDTFKFWYLPEISRADVISMLRDREPGSFIIRNSKSYAVSFSIGVKIPENSPNVQTRPDDAKSGFVRHFLIGTVPMSDGRGNGFQLCGFSGEPTFPSLVAFVHHHILQQGSLPCTLRLPPVGTTGSAYIPVHQQQQVQQQQVQQQQQRSGSFNLNATSKFGTPSPIAPPARGVAADMYYLGSVDVDRLEHAAAIRRAVTQILGIAASNLNALTKRCEVYIKAIPQEGVTFMDKTKRTMMKKTIKPSHIISCGLDPENREFNSPDLQSRGMMNAKIFGIVARKQHFFMHENVVYVFSELHPTQSATNLIQYMNSVFTGQ